jgi:competence protein ComEA
MYKIVRLFAFTLCFLFSSLSLAEVVDINTADVAALDENISGVGPKLAEAIVSFREENGPFTSVDDLTRVKGIGPKMVEKNRANLTVSSQE